MNTPRETPVISVVVPFFRSEEHITACVESLLSSRDELNENVELLFVDNAAPDRSVQLLRRYEEVTLLREDRPGAYAARNAALRVARAPLVAFTDADCAVDPGWLRAIRTGFTDPVVGVLLGHVRYPPDASRVLRLLCAYENTKTEYVLGLPTAYHFAYCNNMAVRASIFEEIGLFEEWQRAGDTELVHRLAARRPDLCLAFRPEMEVTHLEFRLARERARRLSLYTSTNSKIASFRELSLRQRLGVLWRMASASESDPSGFRG
ncbi:MAG: glycosyltransferase family 2 protein [Thermoanaerobaculia bacterium]|nr:glycosyltransferase family 2 protein [Thermoanaerobaculia bacterium]